MTEDSFRKALKRRLDQVTFPPEGCLALRQRIEGEKPMKKKWSAGLILVFALIAVGLTALALNQAGLLRYVLSNPDKASESLSSMVQPLEIQKEEDGVRVRLTGASYDGEKLALSWITENTRPENPVMLSIQSVSANGQRVYPNFSDLDESWRPLLFGLQEEGFDRNAVSGGMIGLVDGPPLSGKAEMALEIAVSRPAGPLVVADEILFDKEDDDGGMREYRRETRALLESSGMTVANKEELDPEIWFKKGYVPVNAGGGVLEEGAAIPGGSTRHIYKQAMKESAVITLRFTLDADRGLAQVRNLLPGQGEVRLEDCSVRINRFSLSPLTTRLDIDLIPHDKSFESALILQERYGNISPTAGKKNLDFADMEFESNGARHQLPDGAWAYHVDMLFPGLNSFPGEVTLSPRWDYFGNQREADISAEDRQHIEAFEKALTIRIR